MGKSNMLPRQIPFTEGQWQAVRVQAALENKFASDIVRIAVNEYLQRKGTRKHIEPGDGSSE